jgi:hypothetical protein
MILLVGPFVAIVGLVAIVFVMRRKSVDKRSMYSARRSQIEHKVRAARQRTLTPHGHAEKAAEPVAPVAAPPAPQATWAKPVAPVAPTVTYQPSAYQPPPEAPAAPAQPAEVPGQSMWDMGPTAAPPAPAQPEAPAYQPPSEPFMPAPEAAPAPPPYEEQWTPGPAPSERVAPVEPEPMAPVEPTRAAAAGGAAWSVVTEQKGTGPTTETDSKKKAEAPGPASSWQLSSGEAPNVDAPEGEVKRPPSSLVAVAQYAILVIGLVMVLIGVLVMVANSHPA